MDETTADTTQTGPQAGGPGMDASVAGSGGGPQSRGDDVRVKIPEFAHLQPAAGEPGDASIKRFYDVNVTISAELGRLTLPIGELLSLGEGAVVELNRSINAPVDLVAQGVLIARGEVVVVDDCFAVRICEIDATGGNDQ
jgi:flagellar motor switch protein FliN/FliY